ncbi:TetR family transcriptional regulator [Actinophytocola xanthii]|uniref:TetR family transcriptional regulator n=1 Tax=Actinophytocola xanthii TaxID=1912961 RepID=A0A1Q8CE27_9PSEU|nr:TetR family transcriptional regulator [Actinophytocola xanthii]
MRVDSSRIPREDARQNRRRILAAARAVFSARGLDAPMATVARRAGVAVATLYRHFPNRRALLAEVFDNELRTCGAVVDDALADPDAWRGFTRAVERLGVMQAVGHELHAAFAAAPPASFDVEAARHEAERKLTELVRRARATGRLRADFHVADLVLMLKAVAGVATGTAEAAPGARRLVAHLLRSFETTSDGPLPPPVRFAEYPAAGPR